MVARTRSLVGELCRALLLLSWKGPIFDLTFGVGQVPPPVAPVPSQARLDVAGREPDRVLVVCVGRLCRLSRVRAPAVSPWVYIGYVG